MICRNFNYTCSMKNHIRTSQSHIPEGMIDLGVGDPRFDLLPLGMLQSATENCFAGRRPVLPAIWTEQGDGYFRSALAGFLGRGYAFPVDPEALFVTNGISNALDLICAHFTRRGRHDLRRRTNLFPGTTYLH